MIEQPEKSQVARRPSAVAASIQPCFSTLGCPDYSLERVAALALEFDVPFLELRVLENRLDLPEHLQNFPGGWSGAREFLKERGLEVRVLGTSFKLVGHDRKQWEELRKFAELAEALGAPYLRAFGGGTWGQPLSPADYQDAAAAAARWEDERRRRGWKVNLLVETHDAFSASGPCLRLLELLSTPLDFIWDSHHTWRLGGEDPLRTWELLAPRVRHVHIKDSINVPSARHPYTYVLPGEGQMPARAALAALEQGGFSGAVSLEWEKMWHPYLPPLPEALQAARHCRWW